MKALNLILAVMILAPLAANADVETRAELVQRLEASVQTSDEVRKLESLVQVQEAKKQSEQDLEQIRQQNVLLKSDLGSYSI